MRADTETSVKSSSATSESYNQNVEPEVPESLEPQVDPLYTPGMRFFQPATTLNSLATTLYAETAASPPVPTLATPAPAPPLPPAPQVQVAEPSPGTASLPSIPHSFPNQPVALSPNGPNEIWTTGSVTSSIANVDSDTAGWFGLLFRDALSGNSSLPDFRYDDDGLDIFGNSITAAPAPTSSQDNTRRFVNPLRTASHTQTSNTSLLERLPRLGRDQLFEKQSWHSSVAIELTPQERFLFQQFVTHISKWMSLFDPKRLFSTFLPHLAVSVYQKLRLLISHLTKTTRSTMSA
jgi:hypothetical protein